MSLLALLQQQQPSLQTRKGLILLGLQNDFVLPSGKLPVKDTGYLDRIETLIPAFREFGDIIWVRTEYEANRPVDGLQTPGDSVVASCSADNEEDVFSDGSTSDTRESPVPTKKCKVSPKSSVDFSKPELGEDDEELFLTRTSTREPCCLRGTSGAQYADRIKPFIKPKDLQVVKTHYSAFGATSLLLTLRSKLITELYVCGNMTNLSVYATAMDAARYGIRIILVTDCLGYRKQDRHDLAIDQLQNLMEADVTTCDQAIQDLRDPPPEEEYEDDESESSDGEMEEPANPAPQDDSLEVDSEQSDAEVTLPTLRRYHDGGLDLRRSGQRWLGKSSRPIDGSGKSKAAPAKHAQPPSSQPEHAGHVKETLSRKFHTQREGRGSSPKLDTAKASHIRRLGILDSPESPHSHNEPWLDIIPTVQPTQPEPTTISPRPRHPGLAALSKVVGLSPATVAQYEEMFRKAQEEQQKMELDERMKPLFGKDKEEESEGSKIQYDLLPEDLAESIFDQINAEVNWQTIHHLSGALPRLVCCQGTVDDDGSIPIYRHPTDQPIALEKWTPAVDQVRQAAEQAVGHSLNHALIQLYRSGNDYISEHSDKTLDIAAGSNIVNVSFGAERTMRIRTKRQGGGRTRTTYRVPLPSNSMITMSLETNAQYLHSINWDRRPQVELTDAEKAFGGQRISLTFRNIGTFLSADSKTIWGQGAVGKTKSEARPVVNGDPEQSQRLINAFGAENAASSISWSDIYGAGTDVLHLN